MNNVFGNYILVQITLIFVLQNRNKKFRKNVEVVNFTIFF